MASSTELWQVGICHQPVAACLAPAGLTHAAITWLPNPGLFRLLADPFGLAHARGFTVLVEALDYRIKRGEIHYYYYDHGWNLVRQGVALRAPFHLSYPFLIPDGDAVYMLPEAYKSGKLTLYRAAQFPDRWEPVATLLDAPAIDASVVQYQGRWWMFYALPGPDGRALRELHIAYADQLTGPWVPHPRNPVRMALDSSRPGGTPFVVDGALYLPTQDCVGGYGMGVNLLRITTLTPEDFAAEIVQRLSPQGLHPTYTDGLHTLCSAGAVTLFDVKRTAPAPMRRWINLERRLRRLVGMG